VLPEFIVSIIVLDEVFEVVWHGGLCTYLRG
jgi:hypothetical protein